MRHSQGDRADVPYVSRVQIYYVVKFLENDDHLCYRLKQSSLTDRSGGAEEAFGFSGTHLLQYDQHGWSFLIVFLAGRRSPDWNKSSRDNDDPYCPPYHNGVVLVHSYHTYCPACLCLFR